MAFAYRTGEKVHGGDFIAYHGNPGQVEFVVEQRTGNASINWFLDENPGGGYMIQAEGWGRVFLTGTDEDLEFFRRGANCGNE